MNDFTSLNISPWLVKKLNLIGVKNASEIQKKVIPFIVKEKKRDVFACSQTGSGKTLAYVLPILERLMIDPRPYFALILAPTRELANQIYEVIKLLTGSDSKHGSQLVKSLLVIGGGNYGAENVDQDVQGLWLGKPNIIVATPGRLLDQIVNRNYLDVCGSSKSFKFEILVLDEADQLITAGFCEQIKNLLIWIDNESQNYRRQTLVFSATLTPALEKLKEIILNKDEQFQPFVVNLLPSFDMVKLEIATNPNLDQRYLLCPFGVKPAYLVECLLDLDFKQLIIFCGTKKETRLIFKVLITLGLNGKDFGFDPIILNSDLKQSLRFAAIDKFKSLKSRVLVTTDLASRGLDLPLVDLIINYNCPKSAISYVHRVGRTCRKPELVSSSNLMIEDNHLPKESFEWQKIEKVEDSDILKNEMTKIVFRKSKVKPKYLGKSITFVTQYDINLLKNIETFIGIRLEKEDAIDEEHISSILKQVAYAVKAAEIAIDSEEAEEANFKVLKKKFKLN